LTFALGLAAAIAAALLFNLGIALQAIEARRSPKSLGLKIGLLGHLLQRPLWLLGAALGIVGFGPQLVALGYAPFAVVQTALTAGLVLLLFVAVRYLGERVERTALAGVALLIAGVALVSWGAPGHSETHRAALASILVVAATALVAFSPFFLRQVGVEHGLVLAITSGVGFAGTNIATKLASDEIGKSHWANATAWGVAVVVLGVCATVTSMSAIQRSAATMVVPVSTAVQTFLPVVLEPLFLHEHYRSLSTQGLPVAAGVVIAVAGVALVGRDRAVSDLAAGK
jgi:drug/metabolite transporter (DMT)-like permease